MNAVVDISLTGRRRNRSWPETLKREIVAASLAPGASVAMVARQYEVNANQLFQWRKLYRDDLPSGSAAVAAAPMLVPVTVATESEDSAAPLSRSADMIEIELGGAYRIRVGTAVNSTALRRVLDVLERR